MTDTCPECGCWLGTVAPHVCDPGELAIAKGMKISRDMREAEIEVIAAADAFYDLAHASLPELRMMEQWREITKRIDLTVQVLRKVRTRQRELEASTERK